ncbi:MAG: anaerobic ribonucleoside-triphosphate reductase activating protein [Leptolinea sp.]|jgi:anaerobic ribonucleoside-triphosphate reductase activating protein|nr:anaerobic ribonucleoside-triphosphate reductase activating protein [Leptolinea sp.]
MNVRLAGITQESVSDGPGMRITVFFQGCEHHCPGCHNPQTWDRQGGVAYSLDEVLGLIKDSPLIKGITLSGGEPFLQAEAAAALACEFHARGKDVWAYTGYLWENLLAQNDPAWKALIAECDVLVDGPFREGERNPGLFFRGSANQRIIDVPASLKQGRVIAWQP